MGQAAARTQQGAATRSGRSGQLARGPMAENDVAEIVTSIGPRVKALRDRHGLSLQQLADRSDVSPAAIHKVEQGTMVPTITTLLKLAAAFDRPVSYFINEDDTPPAYVVYTPADERRTVYTSRQGLTLGGISGPYGQYAIASAVAEVAPGATSGEEPLRHAGEELIHVLSGTLEVSVADRVIRLTPGDSVHFRTNHEHRWRNPGKAPAKAIWTAMRPS